MQLAALNCGSEWYFFSDYANIESKQSRLCKLHLGGCLRSNNSTKHKYHLCDFKVVTGEIFGMLSLHDGIAYTRLSICLFFEIIVLLNIMCGKSD